MRRLLSSWVVVLVVLMFSLVAHAETVQVKAQGTSDAVFGAHDKAFQDAKMRALEKYISGLKSQSEANRLISMKKKLFENIDEYVKEPTELASEERNGTLVLTIQAQIDVTSLNNTAEKAFSKERKKAGVKKKQIAFVFVAREIATVTTVKDHNINESVDNSASSTDESRDSSATGSSKANATSKSSRNKEDDLSVADETTSANEEKSTLAQKAKSDVAGKSASQGSSSSSANIRASSRQKSTLSGDARLEENAAASVKETEDEEGTQRDAVFSGTYAAKGNVSEESQEDAQIKAELDETFSNNEESSASATSNLAAAQTSKTDKHDKFKQNANVKTKQLQDSASSEASDYATSASEKDKNVVKTDNSKYAEAKSTSIQHSEERTYRVIENGTISAQLSEIFTDQGMKVTDSFEAGDLLLKLQKAKSVNQLRPSDLKQAISTAQAEGADYLCIGTLDVDREMVDKATGNIQRYVLVNANTYDLTKQKLEKAAAVGNLNLSGLGESPEVAKNNALNNATKEAATKLISQLRKHMLEQDED